ncbi:MAG TPA: CPBP family intramembrane glutamic endopeptidase [Longimicrobium sp.]|nr:CPBP family intramembrane glutamic endopeptidase [Longimicrobium sp.]
MAIDLSSPVVKVVVPVAAAALVLAAARRRGMSWRDDLGMAPPPAAAAAVWIVVWLAWMLGTDLAMNWRGPWDFTAWRAAPLANSVLRVLAVGVLGPAAEEILFRGFLLHRLRKPLGVRAAIVVTAALWAAVHVDYALPIILLLFGSGLLLGAARVHTRSVWVPVAMHVIWNLYAIW